jgi:MFS family permease
MTTALRSAPFRRLLLALATSQAGDWLYNLALLALVYDRTHSATWVSATAAARIAPHLLAPLGGVLADRCDRRRLLVACDLVRVGCMLALAAVTVYDLPVVWAPVLAALATTAGSPYAPCVAASTPRLVPPEALPGANAARSAVGSLCIVAGPGLGAVLLLLGSTTTAFLVNAVTFAVSAALVVTLPRQALAAAPGGSHAGALAEIGEAWTALRGQHEAVRLVGADVMCSAVGGAHAVLLLVLGRQLGVGSSGYGLLLAAMGAGGLVGTVVASRVAGLGRTRAVLVGACSVVGLPAVLMGVPAPFWLLAVWAFLVGLGSFVVEVATDTSLARCLPDDVLARVFGLTLPASVVGAVGGSLVAPALDSLVGVHAALVLVGLAMTGYAAVVARGSRRAVAAPPALAPLPVAVDF